MADTKEIMNKKEIVLLIERRRRLLHVASALLNAAMRALPYLEGFASHDDAPANAEEKAEREECEKAISALRTAINKCTGRES